MNMIPRENHHIRIFYFYPVAGPVNTFGERLELYAKSRYKTAKALGEALGITSNTLSRYITGKVNPSLEFFEKLAAIGANVDWLVYGRGEMDAPTDYRVAEPAARTGTVRFGPVRKNPNRPELQKIQNIKELLAGLEQDLLSHEEGA